MVKIWAADGGVIGGASDEIFAEVEARVETGEETEVFFFGLAGAGEKSELRDGEGVGGGENQDGRAVGVADDLAGSVALVVARGIVERALGIDVGLLGPEAADKFQTAIEERDIAADVGGGDEFFGPFRTGHLGSIETVGIKGEKSGVGLVKCERFFGADVLNLRETVGGGAQGEDVVEDDARAVVAPGGGGARAGAAISADERVGRSALEIVAHRLAHIEAGFEDERGAGEIEVAAEIGVGTALDVGGAAVGGVGSGEDVVAEVVRIDGSAGRAVGDGDEAGAEIKNLVEVYGYVLAGGGDVVKKTLIGAAEMESLVGVAESALGFPDGALVAIGEGRHVFRALVISRGGGVADLAAADLTAGGCRREIAGGDAVHKKGERALVEWRREECEFGGEGEAVVAGEFVVDGRGGGGAFGVFAAVFDDVVSEVGFVGGRVGILRGRGGSGEAVGGGTGAAPCVGGAGFLGVLFGHTPAEREAEAIVDGFEVREIEAGVNLAGVNPAWAGGLAEEVAVVVAHH